jgi:hypothetical protein
MRFIPRVAYTPPVGEREKKERAIGSSPAEERKIELAGTCRKNHPKMRSGWDGKKRDAVGHDSCAQSLSQDTAELSLMMKGTPGRRKEDII